MQDQSFFNVVALVAIGVVFAAFGVGYVGAGLAGTSGPTHPHAAPMVTTNLYLTVNLNPVTGWPQYTPANFTVTAGEVFVTITDYDAPGAWDGCMCNVTGTAGNSEALNGSAISDFSSANVAHTFDVPALGINALIPGMSTVTFTLFLNQTGSYTWYCEAPCQYPPNGPMGFPGYMTGTMTIVAV